MCRRILPILVASLVPLAALPGQDPQPPAKGELKSRQDSKAKAGSKAEMPPEEDVDLSTTEYSFNPLMSEKDVQVGNYYFKQGKYRAAEGRFRSATRWNDGNADAWLRLGEASEKLKDPKGAREAYTRYLAVAADARNAAEIRKRIARLK
jgi:tetratricopeptide (TPR) repeat protein